MKGLVILGSTGSVGTQTLEIVRSFPDDFNVVGLAAHRSLKLLETQAREFHAKLVCCEGTDEEKAAIFYNGGLESSMEDMVRDPGVDLVVTATVGDVALGPTIAAIEAGKSVALANKESLIMSGRLLTAMAREHGVGLLPLDSEPSAIWQCLRGEDTTVSRLIITASGGAFRDLDPSELADVTPAQALRHPTWKMGPKTTVDSATLMNKAFEV
ncbi:MAG: 1-deoxy-D-xylulose-5-phosphate reductoisomerase, partial [Candidatus Brocadiia bacterium]|nr:1-deoxy-D-xylulose-5-phosphate reductoisomerase [Candidatus Brocadiia bacterium]